MNTKAPSMETIARTLGISRATVSRALRDSPMVSAAIRRKVRRTAEKLGYQYDPKLTELMAHMRKGRTPQASETLAAVVSGGRQEYLRDGWTVYGPMMQGLKTQAERHGFGFEVFHLGDYNYKAPRLSRILWNRGIRGMVIDSLRPEDARLDLDWRRFSAATTTFGLTRPYLHRINHHHLHGIRMAYARLWKLGNRRIGLAMDFRNDFVADHTYLSGYYYDSFHTSGNLLPPFLHQGLTRNPFEKWLREIRPDALIIPGLGLDYLEILESLGYKVPGDLNVATLNVRGENSPFAGIVQRRDIVGAAAANLVASMIFRNETGIPEKPITHHVEGEWKDGATVRKKSSANRRSQPV